MKVSRSPSSMEAAASLCPAGLAAYDGAKLREVQIPSHARDRGTSLHRILEGIQRALMAIRDNDLPPEPIESLVTEALQQAVSSAEVEGMVAKWVDEGWAILPSQCWVEWKLGCTERWTSCEFNDPNVRYRGILDRASVDVREDRETGEEETVLVVTDWKSGWSGFTGVQAELYVLAVDAALSEMPELDAQIRKIVAQKWSPVAIPTLVSTEYERTEVVMAALRERVEAAARVEDRVRIQIERERAAGTPLSERPSARCVWCERRSECETFTGLVERSNWRPLGLDADTDALFVDRYEAAAAMASEALSDLKAHTKLAGPVSGTRAEYGWASKEQKKVDGLAVIRELLSRELPMFGTVTEEGNVLLGAVEIDDMGKRMAKILPPGVGNAKKLAKAYAPKDTPGQLRLLRDWILVSSKMQFGKMGATSDEEVDEE